MTNIINSGMPSQTIGDAPASSNVRLATPQAQGGTATATSEAVTVSANAQVTTQLLDAARASDGVNSSAVAQIRTGIQAGTYNVTPEALANAIAAALKGRTS
ncbi:MAG: flagellar biosynthesis anti-sigma factor FlgM [Acidocella sp.]|nr:flagellar biosynthesis anti-sigma factor FlgM [Acidocella sp.]